MWMEQRGLSPPRTEAGGAGDGWVGDRCATERLCVAVSTCVHARVGACAGVCPVRPCVNAPRPAPRAPGLAELPTED